jgi:iron complex outermembrane receptor protein
MEGMPNRHHLLPCLFACSVIATGKAYAESADSFADFSLEQLAEIKVTSVLRQETRLADAPASVYVISAADIQRTGATTLPDALQPSAGAGCGFVLHGGCATGMAGAS